MSADTKITLGKLQEITDLRSVWKNEATDFTPWLIKESNITLLGNVLGMDLTVDDSEVPVGDFKADIVAKETGTERIVVIENQLEDTNHDHLGKLLVYAAGCTASTIVWIVRHAREEHRAAIEWLNENTNQHIGFFLIEVKLYKINDSAPAVKFEVIEKPNDWAREMRHSDTRTPIQQLRYDYWSAFNDYAFRNADFSKQFNKRKPSQDLWMSLSIGSSVCNIELDIITSQDEIRAGLHLYEADNLYQTLFQHRKEIEQNFKSGLDWLELPGKKTSRILVKKDAVLSNKTNWQTYFDWMIRNALSMKQIFQSYSSPVHPVVHP